MKKYLAPFVLGLALAMLASTPAVAQDLTTMLSRFLVDLRAGTLGVSFPITTETITNSGNATTSTDGWVLENNTAATSTATVQISPRLRFSGTAYNSVSGLSETQDWIVEVLPATNAGTTTSSLRFLRSLNGAAYTQIFLMTSAGAIQIESANALSFIGRERMTSGADALANVVIDAGSFGLQFNTGTAAPTFNNGNLTAGARNMAGQVTLTGANTGGTLTFGAPNWTNAPFCTVSGSAATDTPNITAASVSAITIAGITANGVFTYNCIGRI